VQKRGKTTLEDKKKAGKKLLRNVRRWGGRSLKTLPSMEKKIRCWEVRRCLADVGSQIDTKKGRRFQISKKKVKAVKGQLSTALGGPEKN